MNETILTPILDILDIVGIALFALSGAVIAANMRQTYVTMAFFAIVTGVGGGTIRDLLISAPVFWINDMVVAPVCLLMALIVWYTPVKWWRGKIFDYLDAAGLSAFCVIGSAKALAYDVAPVPAILMGIITGVIGGILRDVVAGRQTILLGDELYITPAALASAFTVGGMFAAPFFGFADGAIWTGAFVAGFSLRCSAIYFELSLPTYAEGAPPEE